MSDFNRVILCGNVGGDPVVRQTKDGMRVASVSLATSEKWNDKQGNPREKTEWHNLILWNTASGRKLADLAERYVNKGDKLLIEGRVQYRSWQANDGTERYSAEVRVDSMTFLTQKAAANVAGARVAQSDKEAAAGGELADADDGLPF